MSNRIPVIKLQTRKQMEKELYNLDLDEYAEQIRNDLRNYKITYPMLYKLIEDDIAERKMKMSEPSMKNMLCNSDGYNVNNRLRCIYIIRNSKKLKQFIEAIKNKKERIKEERANRKLELIKILNDEKAKFGREYSQMERFIHQSLNLNPSQQVRYQDKEDGIFRNKRN